jgi:hypothetical protein
VLFSTKQLLKVQLEVETNDKLIVDPRDVLSCIKIESKLQSIQLSSKIAESPLLCKPLVSAFILLSMIRLQKVNANAAVAALS